MIWQLEFEKLTQEHQENIFLFIVIVINHKKIKKSGMEIYVYNGVIR